MSDLKKIKEEFLLKLNQKLNLSDINEIKSNLFGKNGLVSSQFKKIGSLSENERKKFASDLNIIKDELQNLIELKIKEIQNAEINEKLVKENNNILITKTDNNLGKGGAVKAGLEQVTSTHVVVHDADLEYFPEDISEMFEAISSDQEHLILGSRTIGTKKRKNLYFYTYFGNKVFTLLFSILNNYKVSDIASCYWLVKTESLKKIDISEKGFGIEVEVLSKFIKRKIDIIEVPIRYEARSYEDGKKIKLKDGIQIFLKILKYSKFNIFL